jgi:hypothetical protein
MPRRRDAQDNGTIRPAALVLVAGLSIAGCAAGPAPPAVTRATSAPAQPVREVNAGRLLRPHPVLVVRQRALTPEEEAGLTQVTALVEAASQAYQVRSPTIIVVDAPRDDPAISRGFYDTRSMRGSIAITPRTLTSPVRDLVAAHEMGHYIRRHPRPSLRPEEMEDEANVEAVRILQAGKGWSEEQALRELLIAFRHHARTAGTPMGRGHGQPCEEIRALVTAYPDQRAWASAYECAPR